MDIIEVDPKLFVTCRLCLEDLGQYQIVPSIQQQIKYCFDIEVDSFDGLPQLICMKCKQILNEFHTVKKTYCEKQTNLKSKTLIKRDEIYVQPQQDTVSSSQQISENIEEPATSTSAKKRSLQPSSSSDFESEHSHLQHTKPKKKKKSLRQRAKHRNRWDADYKKQIACKLCNTLWSSKISLWNHSRAHDLLKTRYKNIFDRPCTVKMEKIDGKPNITGFNNTVVHNSNKITVPGNSFYYTVYLKKNENSNNFSNHSESMEPESLLKKALKQDFTDEDEDIISRPKHRKRRILSRSSNDTVVIESNKVLSDNEMDSRITIHESQDQRSLSNDQCINIDDSSDSESEGKLDSSQKGKQPMAAKLGDYKIIQGIISMCVNAYHKKYESPDVDVSNTTHNKKIDKTQVNSESQLKHKVLSIGRKIINKQGFNCTGLLRYMEHKNLEIVWLSKISYTRETNYIRILTKLRGRDTTNDNHGWVNVAASSSSNKVKVISSSVKDTAASNEKSFANTLKSQFVIKEPNQLTNMEASHIEQVKEQLNLDTMPAMLYVDNNVSNSDPKKLLNANPVANPKQLPKKLSLVNESRINKTPAQPSTSTCHTDNDDNHFMPIITHTTSLATVPIIEDSNHNNNNTTDNSASVIVTNKETTAPRIKVKPASELMSERILNSIMKAQSNPASSDSNMLTSQIENVWPHQQPVNVFVPNLTPQMHIGGQPVQIVQVPCIAPKYQVIQPTPTPTTSTIKQDYVILDTSQFPNAKTESPFQYLKDLLQIHNIILLDPCDELSREFICLIKFKVLFKQEAHQDKPVVLCLGIFNCRNIFCLKVKDRNQEHISINKISANWQWEILQIYRGNVVQKVLNNAQKISKETFDFTNTFFCVLKSINIKKKS